MSGYLRRLVTTAKTHERSINPIARPLYATPADQMLPLIQNDEVSPTPLNTEQRVERPIADAAPTPARQPERVQTLLSGVQSVRSVESRQEDHLTAPPEAITYDRPANIIFESREKHNTEQPPERKAPEQPPRQLLPVTSRPARSFEPARSETKPEAIPIRSSNRTSFRASSYEPLKQRAKPEKEPDEIQIHIGRIEVTAVPPPVVRPQSKPAPKSPSLDEYLKRGRS